MTRAGRLEQIYNVGTVVLFVLGVFFCCLWFRLWDNSYGPNPRTVYPHNGVIDIYGSGGQTLEFQTAITKSLGGLWASRAGLTIKIENPAISSQPIVSNIPSKAKDWGEWLGANTDDVVVKVSLTIPPELAGKATVLNGSLEGTVIYPFYYAPGRGNYFLNVRQDVNIAVRLHILPEDELDRLAKVRFWRAFSPLVISLILFSGLVTVVKIWPRYARALSEDQQPRKKTTHQGRP